MIVKPYEINKNLEKKIYLFYGENNGHKEEIINNLFKQEYKNCTYNYTEKEIINNLESFYNQVTSKSFFEDKKLIIINHVTEKFIKEIEELLERNIENIILVLLSGILEKRSKLRIFFEKEKNLTIVPFYKDDDKILSNITRHYLNDKGIISSQETINLIVEKCSGDRKYLKNELEKIENFLGEQKKLKTEDVLKLSNLYENYSINELVNSCLSKNKKQTLKIINENIFSIEDCVIITRSLFFSANRLMNLIKKKEGNSNIEQVISSHKPPIFWKDKSTVKLQINNWSLKSINNLIFKINDIELLIKKNSNNALYVVFDFLIQQSTATNN